MGTYQPTAADFEDESPAQTYKPSASDFEESKGLQEEKPADFNSITAHAMSNLSKMLSHGASYFTSMPGDYRKIKGEFKKDPISAFNHTVEQLGVSLAEGGKGLFNLALQPLRDPLAEQLTGYQLQIPEDTGLQKALNLESNKPGDRLIKKIPDLASALYGGTGLIKKGFQKLGKAPPLSKEKRLQNVLSEEIIKSKKTQAKLKEERQEFGKRQELKFASKNEGEGIGSLTPEGQAINIIKNKAEIKKHEPIAAIPEKEVGSIPTPEVATKEADDIIAKSKEAVERAKKGIEAELEAGEEHVKRAGETIKPHAEKVKSTASDLYNAVRKNYVNKNIVINNGKEIKAATEDLNKIKAESELAPGYGHGSEEQQALEKTIEALKNEKISATDVFDLQRTLDQMSNKLNLKIKKGNLTDLEFKDLSKKANAYENHANKLAKVLENVGDSNAQKMLKQAHEGWKQWKTFQLDTLGRKILKSGKIFPTSMYNLTGTEPNNAFINALIKNNPALKKDVLASQYVTKGKVNFDALKKPDNLTASYLKELPKVDKAVTEFKTALVNEKAGKAEAKVVLDKYKALKDAMTEEANIQKSRKESADAIVKLTNKNKIHKETAIKLNKKIKEEKAAGKNTAKLEEDLARRKREYSTEKTKIDKLKSNLMKLIGTKIGYEAFFKDKH